MFAVAGAAAANLKIVGIWIFGVLGICGAVYLIRCRRLTREILLKMVSCMVLWALLYALLTPHEKLAKLQDEGNFTLLMAEQERIKDLPFAAVWEEYLKRQGKEREYYPQIRKYEIEELGKR